MSRLEGCPVHGDEDGRTTSLDFSKTNKFGILGKRSGYRCDLCKKIYISTNKINKGFVTKTTSGYKVENIGLIREIPNIVYIYNKADRKGACKCKNYKKIFSFMNKFARKVTLPLEYCEHCKKYYILVSTLISDNNLKAIIDNNITVMDLGQILVSTSKIRQLLEDKYLYYNSEELCDDEDDDSKQYDCFEELEESSIVSKAYMSAKIDFNPYQYLPWYYLYVKKENRNILISDEVGLGKTIEAGIIINEELIVNKNKKVLVICPAFLKNKWSDELKYKFFMNPKIYSSKMDIGDSKIIILPVSQLRQFIEKKEYYDFGTIIIDEVHYFKNEKSARYDYLRLLLDKYQQASLICMSATPINNSDSDYISIKKILGRNYDTTNTTKKEAYIYLKNRKIESVYVDLSESEQKIYDVTDGLPPFSGTIYRHIGASSLSSLLRYAKRDSQNPSETKEELNNALDMLLFDDNYNDEPIQYEKFYNLLKQTPLIGDDSKLEALINLLKNIKEKKIIIFSHYIETILYLQDQLSKQYNCGYIYANNSSNNIPKIDRKDRFTDAKKWFESQIEQTILICSDSCKEGIDLQNASCLINYDLPFNPSILEQRIGRIDRKGQKNDMKIFNFHVNNTYDDRLHCILDMKLRIINYFAEYGVGNPLDISDDRESALDRYIRYFDKNENVNMSNDDKTTMKRILRKIGIKTTRQIKAKELLKIIIKNKEKVVSYFSDKDIEKYTDEQLVIKKNNLENVLNFPKLEDGNISISDDSVYMLIDKINKEPSFKKKITSLIIDYDLKLKRVIDTGEPMVITEDDIKRNLSYTSNNKNGGNFISQSLINQLKKEGIL